MVLRIFKAHYKCKQTDIVDFLEVEQVDEYKHIPFILSVNSFP